MILIIFAWVGTIHYIYADDPWQGMPGVILTLLFGESLPEVRFVVQQSGKIPAWGGLDPLGWATDYNGHPSTHRVKMLVSVILAGIVILFDVFGSESEASPGRRFVSYSLLVVPYIFAFVFEAIERRAIVKKRHQVGDESMHQE